MDSPARRHPRNFASHGPTLKEGATGDMPANFDDSSAQLQDVEDYRALIRSKFPKQPEYVILRIVDEPKQTLDRPKHCIRWYKYDSYADM